MSKKQNQKNVAVAKAVPVIVNEVKPEYSVVEMIETDVVEDFEFEPMPVHLSENTLRMILEQRTRIAERLIEYQKIEKEMEKSLIELRTKETELKKEQLLKAGFTNEQADKMINALTSSAVTKTRTVSSSDKIDDKKVYQAIIAGNYETLNDAEKSLAGKISCIHRGFRGEGKGSLNCLSGMISHPKDVIIAHALLHGQKFQVPLIKRYLKMKTM